MYLDMAMGEDVCVRKGHDLFRIVYEPAASEQPFLEPDDDDPEEEERIMRGIYNHWASFYPDGQPPQRSDKEDLRRAITAEELLAGIHEDIRETFGNLKRNAQ